MVKFYHLSSIDFLGHCIKFLLSNLWQKMMKQDLSAISAIKVILSMKMYKHILNQHIEETGMIVSNVNIVQHTSIIWRGILKQSMSLMRKLSIPVNNVNIKLDNEAIWNVTLNQSISTSSIPVSTVNMKQQHKGSLRKHIQSVWRVILSVHLKVKHPFDHCELQASTDIGHI